MGLDEFCILNTRKIAEYFVVCGLPDSPNPFNSSDVITHAEEIIIPDVSVDFTMFQEPIVDIKIVSVRDNEEIPYGYHPIKRTHSGRFKANIKGRIGDEVYLCYRRGRDKPPITDLAMFTDSPSNRLLEDAKKITKTCGGKSANFRSSLIHPVYLSYRRAPKESGIDRLAVTDMCIIIPSKHETCPPAFNQVADSLNSNPLVNQMYLCFRKSLIKQYIIAYDPEVLFWYRVREPGVELEMTDREGLETSSQENTVPNNRLTHDSLDPDIRQVANFCLPWGAALESWSVEQEPPEPNFFTFVLTNESYQRLYGVAFTFYEPYDVSQLDMDKCYRLGVDPELLVSRKSQSSVLDEADAEEEARIREIQKHFFPARIGDRVVGVTKTMCLLSRWSFPVAFTNFLAFLYSRWQPAAKDDPIPFERYLSYFLCEVPFPSQSMPHVMVELCAAPILLNFPDDNDAVSKCEPFFFLLDCLGVDLTIQLLVQMLTEQKILLTSVRPFLLTQIGEALTSMIFPLRWTVVYIPFIYIGCIHVIQSPSPYLIGVDSRFFDFFRLPPGGGVTYVDLDTRNFKLPEPGCSGQPVLDAKSLPKKPLKQLKAALSKLFARIITLRPSRSRQTTNVLFRCMFSQAGSQLANNELTVLERRQQWLREFAEMATIGLQIKNTFMHFMAQLLKCYQRFLIPVRQAERDVLFNASGFLKEIAEKHSRPFYVTLFETQQWANFVRDRSYVSARDEELSRFDSYMVRLFGDSADESPVGSQSLSDSPNSSLRGFGDRGSEGCTQPGSANSAETVEEPRILKMLSSGSISNEAVHVVGPPKWPILGADPQLSVELSKRQNSDTDVRSSSVKLNEKLLDLFVSHAYLEHAPATIGFGALDATDSSTYLWRCQYASSRSDSSQNLSVNARHLGNAKLELFGPVNDPLLVSLMTSDTPSPFISRSSLSMALSLTGLPTRYPLPVGGSVILRRSPLELHQTAEFVKRASVEGGLVWAHHLISSMYTLWFMLLPSYLASVYAATTEQRPPADQECRLAVLNETLSNAVLLAGRLQDDGVLCHDQVMMRIILALVYQHRPSDINLTTLLDSPLWNSSSMGLVNLIFKTFEKERQDKERLELKRLNHSVAHTHRRSASLTYEPVETLASQEMQTNSDRFDAESNKYNEATTRRDTRVEDPNLLLIHRRSSSSTAASLVPSAINSVAQSKSETDSGLVMGNPGDEDSTLDDESSGGQPVLSTVVQIKDKSLSDSLEKQIEQMKLTGKRAPLASVTELDLGYSTLNRSGAAEVSSTMSSTLRATDLTPIPGFSESMTFATVENTEILQCAGRQSLEAVQKPPLDMVQEAADSVIWPGRNNIHSNHHDAPLLYADKIKPEHEDDDSDSRSDDDSSTNTPSHPRLTVSQGSQSNNPSEYIPTSSPQSRASRIRLQKNRDSYSGSSLTIDTDTDALGNDMHRNQKPRGSLDYLNDAISKFGKSTSDLLSRFNIPMRSWLGTGAPNTPISDYRPWIERRATAADLAAPGSARTARRTLIQGTSDGNQIGEDDQVGWGSGDEPQQTVSSPDFWNPRRNDADADSDRSAPSQRTSDLSAYTNYCMTVADSMANGNAHQRSFPATLATLKRGTALNSTGHPSKLSPSPFPARVPVRSSSMEPSLPTGLPQPNQATMLPAAVSGNITRMCNEQFREDPMKGASHSDLSNTSAIPVASDCSPSPISGRFSNPPPVQFPVCRLNVIMTTCNTCPTCKRFVHDEEIMASWSSDENEYSIPCPFCDGTFVPLITVRILGDVYTPNLDSPVPESGGEVISLVASGSTQMRRRGSLCSTNGSGARRRHSPFTSRGLMEFTQHYLSPLVLRKSLETVILHEGDESLRHQSPGQCFLYKHEELTWSLVWYTQRIGLLTNLLDALPSWLLDQQIKAQKRVATVGGATVGGTRRTESGTVIPNALLQVKLSPDLPVMLSLRWNSYQMARSKPNTPLYKQFLFIKDECKSSWSLVPGGLETNPVVPAGTLGLSTTSDCPVDATIAQMLNAIRNGHIQQALDTLIAFRACILDGKPISRIIHHGLSVTDGSVVPGLTVSHGKSKPSSSGCRTRCTDSHKGAWCLQGSLYRELLFFTITVFQPVPVNFLAFDYQFNAAFFSYRANDCPYLHDSDRAPCLVACTCRQMLRPLTLIP